MSRSIDEMKSEAADRAAFNDYKAPPLDKELTNRDRAMFAAQAILEYRTITNSEDCDVLSDLLGDLKHWADQNEQDFDAELARAELHYAEEVTL